MANNIYKSYVLPGGSGGMYIKLQDGDSVKVRIVGEPYIFTDEKFGSTRFAWAVLNQDEGKAQILQLPATGYKSVAAIATDEDWGDVADFDIKITREGSGTDTRYHLTPSPNRSKLFSAQLDLVATLDIEKAIPGARPLADIVGTETKESTDVAVSAEADANELNVGELFDGD